VHHGHNAPYIDKNFGVMFIVWDRLFGTFAKEEEPVVYGVGSSREMAGLLDVQFGELGRWMRSSWRKLWNR
jgi:sterol desaturase/sphingolipid hydroxylase (fatty acid hydroxylase superfamily)